MAWYEWKYFICHTFLISISKYIHSYYLTTFLKSWSDKWALWVKMGSWHLYINLISFENNMKSLILLRLKHPRSLYNYWLVLHKSKIDKRSYLKDKHPKVSEWLIVMHCERFKDKWSIITMYNRTERRQFNPTLSPSWYRKFTRVAVWPSYTYDAWAVLQLQILL